MKDGIIELNSKFANEIGFTSNNFSGFLWKVGGYIYISYIKSLNPGQGKLSSLFNNIQKKGFGIKVPTPFSLMESICKQKGFKLTYERDNHYNEKVDVWVLEKQK